MNELDCIQHKCGNDFQARYKMDIHPPSGLETGDIQSIGRGKSIVPTSIGGHHVVVVQEGYKNLYNEDKLSS